MSDDLRVLLVSLYHPDLVRGGSQQVCYDMFEGLRARAGVRPTLLASAIRQMHPGFDQSNRTIRGFDGRPDEFLLMASDYDPWWHKSNDPAVIEAYASFLEQVRPDVVHFHHYLTLGVDLLTLTRRILPKARVVLTFHEFATICAADGQMVRRTDQSLCERASPVKCHQCFPDRSPEAFVARKLWFTRHLEAVDVFTCPGRFMLERYEEWGIPAERLVHVDNGQRSDLPPAPTPIADGVPYREFNRFGFFGQLQEAKGVLVLLEAVERLRAEGFCEFSVEINSGSPHGSEAFLGAIERFARAEAERPPAERIVEFRGEYGRADLARRMERIDWCLVPSIWTEASPLVIAEACAHGKPILCSNVGAMLERVEHERTGLHFDRGDSASLANAIRRACTDDALWPRLAAAVPSPPSYEGMLDRFLDLYRGPSDRDR